MNTRFGPFYDGLTHLFVTPEDLLPVIALALLAGRRGPRFGRVVLFALPVAWLVGSATGTLLAASVRARWARTVVRVVGKLDCCYRTVDAGLGNTCGCLRVLSDLPRWGKNLRNILVSDREYWTKVQ
jgi:hypothetical protein